jgi:hypothetical protein
MKKITYGKLKLTDISQVLAASIIRVMSSTSQDAAMLEVKFQNPIFIFAFAYV